MAIRWGISYELEEISWSLVFPPWSVGVFHGVSLHWVANQGENSPNSSSRLKRIPPTWMISSKKRECQIGLGETARLQGNFSGRPLGGKKQGKTAQKTGWNDKPKGGPLKTPRISGRFGAFGGPYYWNWWRGPACMLPESWCKKNSHKKKKTLSAKK